MNLNRLLLINAFFTFAAGIVLIIAPGLIPGAVGIHLDPGAYLVCYLLGASELSLAALCYYGRALKGGEAMKVVIVTCMVFHISSGMVEIYAFARGASIAVLANVLVRVIFSLLFWYYGFYKTLKAGVAGR
jgi:hypothetical protein